MKTLFSIVLIALCTIFSKTSAQEQYTVDGKQYSLFTAIDGPLTLLWNTIDGEYRYFCKKEDSIVELTSTKVNGSYQKEFRETLALQTSDTSLSVEKLRLTNPSLSLFFIQYNTEKDPSYTHETVSTKINTRLALFGGLTNSVYNRNPTNALTPVAGIDFEIVDHVKLRRHSIVLRFKQAFENSDTKSSSSQVSLNYRLKFVQTPKFDVFINTKFVAYTHSNREFTVTNDDEVSSIVKESGGNLTAPAAFGIGADYALGNGYITFSYNDIVAVGVTSNGAFPTDLTLGYKFNL